MAVWPDEATRRTLASLPIRPVDGLRAVATEEWHVTLRFLGHLEPDLVPDLQEALARAAARQAPARARLGPATMWFGRPGVLVVPVTGLEVLAAEIRGATEHLSPAEEAEASFAGHLTLARADRRRRPAATTRAAVAGLAVAGEFAVDGVDLVVSEPHAGGHRYRTLATFPLGPGARR